MSLQLLFATPNTWCTRAMARRSDGTSIDDTLRPEANILTISGVNDPIVPRLMEEIVKPEYTQFCLVGAMLKMYGSAVLDSKHPITMRIKAAIFHRFRDETIVRFNDVHALTLNEIREIVRLANV
jgi:hypothetical protein